MGKKKSGIKVRIQKKKKFCFCPPRILTWEKRHKCPQLTFKKQEKENALYIPRLNQRPFKKWLLYSKPSVFHAHPEVEINEPEPELRNDDPETL